MAVDESGGTRGAEAQGGGNIWLMRRVVAASSSVPVYKSLLKKHFFTLAFNLMLWYFNRFFYLLFYLFSCFYVVAVWTGCFK